MVAIGVWRVGWDFCSLQLFQCTKSLTFLLKYRTDPWFGRLLIQRQSFFWLIRLTKRVRNQAKQLNQGLKICQHI